MSWYGARLTDQYGMDPPADWCAVVDEAPNSIVAIVLDQIKTKHVTHPPTFPEIDALFAKARPSATSDGPSVQERLVDFVLANKPLTHAQKRIPWTFIGRSFDATDLSGKVRANHGIEISGVVVPQCPDTGAEGFRVMVEDMQLAAAA